MKCQHNKLCLPERFNRVDHTHNYLPIVVLIVVAITVCVKMTFCLPTVSNDLARTNCDLYLRFSGKSKRMIFLTFAFAKVPNNEPTNKKTLNKIAKPHNLLNRIYQLYSYYQLVKRSIGQSVNQSIST